MCLCCVDEDEDEDEEDEDGFMEVFENHDTTVSTVSQSPSMSAIDGTKHKNKSWARTGPS